MRNGAQDRRENRGPARLRRPPIGVGVAAILALPGVAADTDLGLWRFAVTAAGNGEFRGVHAFPSRRTCEERHDTIRRGVAQVVADQGGKRVGRFAHRLHLGPCEPVRPASAPIVAGEAVRRPQHLQAKSPLRSEPTTR